MPTKLIRFHSANKLGVIRPDYEKSMWLRNGAVMYGRRSDMRVGDVAATFSSRFDSIRTLLPITKVEIIQ